MAHGRRSFTSSVDAAPPASGTRRNEWRAVGMLLPYLWEYKWRGLVAMVFLASAKLANVGVPLVLKNVVDSLSPAQQILALPLALLIAYGLLRLSTVLFAELRDLERGTRGISTLLSFMLFSVIPVILEFSLVAAVLLTKFDWRFAAVTFAALAIYIFFTVSITAWG